VSRLPGVVIVVVLCAAAWGQDRPVRKGEVDVDPPTWHCIGARWFVDNLEHPDATVKVAYRKKGAPAWKEAMPFFRVNSVALETRRPPEGITLYAGSIFDLTPDTEYEVRLSLADANGRKTSKTFTARTWKEPFAPKPKRTLHVSPGNGGGVGTRAKPLRGIHAAEAVARPGDLFLLHKGTYLGYVSISTSGTAKTPIVWRAAGDGEVVLEAPEKKLGLNARGLKHVFFEGLTFTKGSPSIRVGGSSFLTFRRCNFDGIYWGIVGAAYQERLVIVDCTFKGPRTWPRTQAQRPLGENRAIELSGVGHVIAHNRMSGFRDGVDTRMSPPVRGVDIHNNDISEMTDDGIELDFSESNCRAYRNRITNCYVGISFQPSHGGPNYAVRNVMYNLGHETYKLHYTGRSNEKITSGGVMLHNTVVRQGCPLRVWAGATPVQHYFMRNNLYVVTGAKRMIDMQCDVKFADWDYDVFVGGYTQLFGKWFRTFYRTYDDFVAGTAQEKHCTRVESTKGVFATDVQPPADFKQQAPINLNDLRLAKTSPAIDKGTPLPNINDGFTGAAPDAGAYELDTPLPRYGPR